MPSFDPSVVPTISPSNLLTRFIEDQNINIRWFTAQDPLFYQVLNRPIGDITLRQLILAKAIDQLNVQGGRQLLYPFLIQPKLSTGTVDVDIPTVLFWDVNVRLDKRFENLRLATVTRLSGQNPSSTSDEYTGSLRFTFEANNLEVSDNEIDDIFYVDMEIDSTLLLQIVRITPAGSGADVDTEGFFIFKTPDQDNAVIKTFLDAAAPPISGATDTEGNYTSPTVYNVADSPAGGTSEPNDFNTSIVSHGTGSLLVSVSHPLLIEIDPIYTAEKGQPLGTATLDSGGNVPVSQLGNAVTAETDPIYTAEKGQPLGTATLDSGGNVPVSQLGNVHSNANDPTVDEKAALAGTVGLPSNGNRYVTDQDARNTNARNPVAHKDTHVSGGTDQFIAADLLEAVVKRIRETSGPTDLTVGNIVDGAFLQRSGASVIGSQNVSTFFEGILTGEIVEQSPLALGVRTVGLTVVKNGIPAAITDQNVNFGVAHPTNPRVDILQWDGSALTIKAGTPAVIPFCPTPDPNNIILCAVHITPAAIQIRSMNEQDNVAQGVIVAFYYVRGGLYASRVGVTDSPGTASTSFVDAPEMHLSVYFPRAGAGYEIGWDAEGLSGATGTPIGLGINIQIDEADENEDKIGRRQHLPHSVAANQAGYVEAKTTKGSMAIGPHRIKGRFKDYIGTGVTLRKMCRRIWIKENH